MIKYTKVADATEAMDDLELGKVRLSHTDGEEGSIAETPWVKKMSDGRQILVNHALCFHPFPSWGMIIGDGYEHDVTSIREAKEIPLHPEAFDYYIEEGLIDEAGNFKQHTDEA